MKLLAAIQRFFTEPYTSEVDRLRLALKERTKLHAEQLEESDEIWRKQMTELINQHCVERSAWARERRTLIELEQRARTAMAHHLSGKTRVSSVGDVRMQIDVPAGDDSDPLDLLAGFGWLLVSAGYADTEDERALKRTRLMSRVPPMNPVDTSLVARTTPTEPKLGSAEVSSDPRREARQAAVLGLQGHKDD